MATMTELRERLSELLAQAKPMQADYDRAIKLWVKAERDATAAYLAMAEIVDGDQFGVNSDSLQALMRYHEADIALMEAARKVAGILREHGAVRDEIRDLMHRISARLTYALATDLTHPDMEHTRDTLMDERPQIMRDAIRTVVRSDDPAAKRLVERAEREMKEQRGQS